MRLRATEILDWIYQHDQVWEDFTKHFGIEDYLKELPEDKRSRAVIRIEEDSEIVLSYDVIDDAVDIV